MRKIFWRERWGVWVLLGGCFEGGPLGGGVPGPVELPVGMGEVASAKDAAASPQGDSRSPPGDAAANPAAGSCRGHCDENQGTAACSCATTCYLDATCCADYAQWCYSGFFVPAHWSSGDCIAYASGDHFTCTTSECLGIVAKDPIQCDFDDCKAFASGDWTLCASLDCKAILKDDASLCETQDCKGIVSGDAAECQSEQCGAYVAHDPGLCP